MGKLTLEWWSVWDDPIAINFRIVDQKDRHVDEYDERGPCELFTSFAQRVTFFSWAYQHIEYAFTEPNDAPDIRFYTRGYVEDDDYIFEINEHAWERVKLAVLEYNQFRNNNTLTMEDVVWQRESPVLSL